MVVEDKANPPKLIKGPIEEFKLSWVGTGSHINYKMCV